MLPQWEGNDTKQLILRLLRGRLQVVSLFVYLGFQILDSQHAGGVDDRYEGAIGIQRHLLRLGTHRVPCDNEQEGHRRERRVVCCLPPYEVI